MILRTALWGAGNVTRAFLDYWQKRSFGIDLRVVSVLRKRGVWHGEESAGIDLDALTYQSDLDPFNKARVVIEALPSRYREPATSLLWKALEPGIDVLTVW